VQEIAELVEGVARGVATHEMVLAGGETAQMPGLYQHGHFDLAGTILGVVEEDEALHGDRIVPATCSVGYASSGLHTNGYTLARRVVFERMGHSVDSYVSELGSTLGDALLAVHRSYARAVRPVITRCTGSPTSPVAGSRETWFEFFPPAHAPRWIPPPGRFLRSSGSSSVAAG
jgi:phosphoribosylformylglycinamidine cyclo-ligase